MNWLQQVANKIFHKYVKSQWQGKPIKMTHAASLTNFFPVVHFLGINSKHKLFNRFQKQEVLDAIKNFKGSNLFCLRNYMENSFYLKAYIIPK